MDTGTDKIESEDKPTEIEGEGQSPQEEELEVYVEEEEGDQKKPTMSQEAAYAAFRKEQKKRKEKQKLIDAEKEENARLKAKLEDLESKVGQIVKGEPPTLESCNFDEAVYQQKTREYYTGGTPSRPPEPTPEPKGEDDGMIDQALFYLHQNESELSQAMPGYSDSKSAVEAVFKANDLQDTERAFAYIANIARLKGVSAAKAIVAIDKNPNIVSELLAVGDNQILAGEIIEKAANKVKTRKKKAIDSQPEPDISNQGPVDYTAAQVEKLRKSWVDKPSAKNYAAYKQAKQRLKGE